MTPPTQAFPPTIEEMIRRSPVFVFIWRAAEGWPIAFASGNVRQFGYTPEDFYSGSTHYASIIHPDDLPRVVAEVAAQESRGEDIWQEYRIRTRPGEERVVEERSTPRRDAEGRITHYEGVVIDITSRRQAEQRLADQLRFLQILIDAIPIPVYYKDLDGPYRGCNLAFSAMAGRPREEIVGHSVHEVWPKRFADRYREMDLELLREPGNQAYETEVSWSDGTVHPVVLNRATYTDPDGRLAGIVGVVDDATSRKQTIRLLRESGEALEARVRERTSELVRANEDLERQMAERVRAERQLVESERRFADLADSLPQAVFETDADGRLVWVNRNASRMFGHPRELLLTMSVPDLLASHERERSKERFRRILAGEEAENEEHLALRADGTVFPIMVSAQAIAGEPGPAGVRGLIVDISDRVAVERMKSEFLSVASHELRTPLTPLRLVIQQSRRKLAKGEPVLAEAVERMERQARRLSEMVNDLLDVSRLERGLLAVHPASFDLRVAVSEVVEDFRYQFGDRVLTLELPSEPVGVHADLLRIEQVVANLIDNALKYAPDSEVSVEVSADEEWATVKVTDSGPGIDASERAGLFTRFYRTGPVNTRTQRGLGLGLYICRELMDRHGGSIELESELGAGTALTIKLPIYPLPAPG